MTCLFVGNLIKAASETKLTSVFRSYGKCTVELKGPYAFIEYDEAEDAKNAIKELNKTNLKGVNGVAKARIEFAKKKKGNGKLEANDISVDEYEDVFSDHSESGENQKKYENFEKSKQFEADDNNIPRKKNVCFICKLPGHFAKDCILTKESCYECGEKGHIAKECQAGIREAKILTENRVKAINSQQSAYKYVSPSSRIKNIVAFLSKNK
jgi:hypothetical protein